MDTADVKESKREHILPADPACDRLMPLWEVTARLRTDNRIVAQLVNLKILPCIGIKSNRRVRVFAFNDFLRRIDGQDLSEILKEATLKIKKNA